MKKPKIPNYELRMSHDPEDNIYIVRVPELAGVHSHGKTPEEALKNVQEAIALAIEVMIEDGEEIPVPISEKKFSGQMPLRMRKDIHKDLVIAAQEENRSANEIAVEAVASYLRNRNVRKSEAGRSARTAPRVMMGPSTFGSNPRVAHATKKKA